MLLTLLFIFAGLFILILGGNFLVKGASKIALRFRISPLVIGVTIVAFGTSAPELLISIKSALAGSPDLAMGNVIGSNICNLALVLGLMALISPVPVHADSIKLDWPMTMGSSILLYFSVRGGELSYSEGIFFIILLITYTFFIIRRSRKVNFAKALDEKSSLVEDVKPGSILNDILFIVMGCLGLYYGADWFVGGAQDLAVILGVNERVIGITVVALGTSLPELVTAIVAAYKKETDIAIGNLMGSNIFNILSILGITSIIKSIQVSEIIMNFDIIWMLAITFLTLPFMLFRRTITRVEGGILLLIYLVYTYIVIS
ncbi:MAG: calcium/sodium antiporter [Bacteroidota bacterium]|jgi:cation:H+ antiporter|nr:calcium/sodium antiporter [Bacteroidota bacterium]